MSEFAPEIRDVFGDFDDEDQQEDDEARFADLHDIEHDSNVSCSGRY